MDEIQTKTNSPDGLQEFSFKQRMILRASVAVTYLLLKIVGLTIRFEESGAETTAELDRGGGHYILGAWHEFSLIGTYFFRNRRLVGMVSKSFDGEYAAQLMSRFGFEFVRGSSSRGGREALSRMLKWVGDGRNTCLMIDGPKGPRREAKLGVCRLASGTGNPMVPIMFAFSRVIRLRSWDQLCIPVPFSRVRVSYGEPITVSPSDDLEEKRSELHQALDELEQADKVWLESLAR